MPEIKKRQRSCRSQKNSHYYPESREPNEVWLVKEFLGVASFRFMRQPSILGHKYRWESWPRVETLIEDPFGESMLLIQQVQLVTFPTLLV